MNRTLAGASKLHRVKASRALNSHKFLRGTLQQSDHGICHVLTHIHVHLRVQAIVGRGSSTASIWVRVNRSGGALEFWMLPKIRDGEHGIEDRALGATCAHHGLA